MGEMGAVGENKYLDEDEESREDGLDELGTRERLAPPKVAHRRHLAMVVAREAEGVVDEGADDEDASDELREGGRGSGRGREGGRGRGGGRESGRGSGRGRGRERRGERERERERERWAQRRGEAQERAAAPRGRARASHREQMGFSLSHTSQEAAHLQTAVDSLEADSRVDIIDKVLEESRSTLVSARPLAQQPRELRGLPRSAHHRRCDTAGVKPKLQTGETYV